MKICKKCGAEFDTTKCKACKKAYAAANPEKNKMYSEKYNMLHPDRDEMRKAKYGVTDETRARYAAYRAKNKESRNAYSAKWRLENKSRMSKLLADWRAKNPGYVAKWKAQNPQLNRVYKNNYRASKLKNGGKLSNGLADRLFKLQRGKCACCSQPLGDDYQMDHIMPLSLGGANTDDNIQLLRQRCNNQKRAKHPIYFMQTRGFLL